MSNSPITVAYPAEHDAAALEPAALAAKVARHSPCAGCDGCRGLRPAHAVRVVLDNSAEAFNLRLLPLHPDHPDTYLATCACGHTAREHGALDALDPQEYARRVKVAIRIDELLSDKGKLLDFTYTDSDITSLRKQMKLREDSLGSDLGLFSPASSRKRSSSLSSLNDGLPPAKKQRVSSSELSEDEDEQPLAAAAARNNGHSNGRAGKKTMPGMTLAGPSKVKPPPPQPNGMNGKIKTEDGTAKFDHSQLARIATGVPVDTSGQASAHPGGSGGPRQEKAANVELRAGIIRIVAVENDGAPRSRILLTGLKTLFQKQLPKMPREYIARLVFDENSRALAIIKRGLKVVGGIAFRPFPHRGFAEIVFFATASVDQVRGYGSLLMNHFKTHIRNTYPNMNHFLTYADNYAVGYFRKQGFSKEITLERSIWAGYIKDYEGGTLMQCTMVRKVDYLNSKDALFAQREAILSKIRERSRSHVVYPGLTCFADGQLQTPIDPARVPGLRETGWTADMAAAAQSARPVGKNGEEMQMKKLLTTLMNHKMAWPFQHPVNRDEVLDYYDVIKNPMDFSLMEHKLEHHRYGALDDFVSDCQLIFSNCLTYNPENTIYAKCALVMRKFLETQLQQLQHEV